MLVGRSRRVGAAVFAAILLTLGARTASSSAQSAATGPVITISPSQPAGPAFMGLGVEWDPYDALVPTQADWNLAYQRLSFMRPGFLRVVEPASEYFKNYDAYNNPVYRWTSPHVVELLKILSYAQSRHITVMLGDWGDPMLHGDARIPADFLEQLHDNYGFTDIRYYDPMNEPNYDPSCDFSCWTGTMGHLSAAFQRLGLTSWLKLVGPDDGDSWDDTSQAQALDRSAGLDADNPSGGDSWVTQTLQSIPSLISAYDSHRYATIWGIQNGVYEDQMRARREEISNLASPSQPYFEGEAGISARTVDPFMAGRSQRQEQALAAMTDPSTLRPEMSPFVDSQPHIDEFRYGVWMGDMMVQAITAGLSGASAWELDDAMHVGGQYGARNLKRWGFWNSLGGQDGYPASDLNPRPWYYAWSVLSRSFPSGSQPLTVPDTGVPGLRVAAATVPQAGGAALSVAVVNDSNAAQSLTLAMPSPASAVNLERYDYFAYDHPTDSSGFPVPAQILSNASLPAGVRIELPSRGLVVLHSIGPAVVPTDAAVHVVLNSFGSWAGVVSHSRGLAFDRSSPAEFNFAPSRVTSVRKRPQYLQFAGENLTGFELKAYYRVRLGLRVYGSTTGRAWKPIRLASTRPAPTIGGQGWYLVDLMPRSPLPPAINQLKIELSNRRTELSQLRLEQAG